MNASGTALGWLIAALLVMGATDAAAVCTTCYEWGVASSPSGRPTTPTYANGLVTHAVEGVIYLRRLGLVVAGDAPGSAAAKYSSGSDIRRSPALTELPDPQPGHWYVFATLTSGYLVKLDVPDPVSDVGTATLQLAKTANVDQNVICAAAHVPPTPCLRNRSCSAVQIPTRNSPLERTLSWWVRRMAAATPRETRLLRWTRPM